MAATEETLYRDANPLYPKTTTNQVVDKTSGTQLSALLDTKIENVTLGSTDMTVTNNKAVIPMDPTPTANSANLVNSGSVKAYADAAAFQMFVDAWNTVFTVNGTSYGTYNETTGYFEANGLTDITYAQAKNIFYKTNGKLDNCSNAQILHSVVEVRTNVPIQNSAALSSASHDLGSAFNSSSIEIINLRNVQFYYGVNSLAFSFYNCKVLKEVQGVIYCNFNIAIYVRELAKNAVLLKTIYLYRLQLSIDFGDCPLFDKDSIIYLLTNRANAVGTPITITLHATAYATYSVDADVVALLAETSTQGAVNLASA